MWQFQSLLVENLFQLILLWQNFFLNSEKKMKMWAAEALKLNINHSIVQWWRFRIPSLIKQYSLSDHPFLIMFMSNYYVICKKYLLIWILIHLWHNAVYILSSYLLAIRLGSQHSLPEPACSSTVWQVLQCIIVCLMIIQCTCTWSFGVKVALCRIFLMCS